MRGSAKYPGERRRTDEQFQFHTRNPALVSSACSSPVSPVKGGEGVKGQPENDWKKEDVPCKYIHKTARSVVAQKTVKKQEKAVS